MEQMHLALGCLISLKACTQLEIMLVLRERGGSQCVKVSDLDVSHGDAVCMQGIVCSFCFSSQYSSLR